MVSVGVSILQCRSLILCFRNSVFSHSHMSLHYNQYTPAFRTPNSAMSTRRQYWFGLISYTISHGQFMYYLRYGLSSRTSLLGVLFVYPCLVLTPLYTVASLYPLA